MNLPWYYDFSCPYAWLSSLWVEDLAARCGATLEPRPILLGGVFRARGAAQNMAAGMVEGKARHNAWDLERHARLHGKAMAWHPRHPVRTVTALRTLLVAGEEHRMALTHRFFAAYWEEHRDLDDDAVVAAVLDEAGLDGAALVAATQDAAAKDDLRQRTAQALDDGVFGVPAFVIGGELYWGQDRRDEVERLLGGTPAAPARGGELAPTDFWFDYSSPWAWVGSLRVEEAFGDAVRFRPMLLGAVFQAVGQPMVPLHAFSDAKRAWYGKDLLRQAGASGGAVQWPSRFPLRTVLPLRVTLLAGPDSPAGRRFVHRAFRGCWEEDADPADPTVVAGWADECGLDGADLVARATEPDAKHALFAAVAEAVGAGVFGAPTLVVHAAEDHLFWGSDRIELARRAAAGDRAVQGS